ncbi:MAG TPA: sugar ABC transporter permease [Phycisphaeraceae bacterium]
MNGSATLLQRLWRGRWGYAFIAPAMGLLILVHLYPILRVFQLSLSYYSVSEGTTAWAGLRNYAVTFQNELFYVALRNTVVYTLIVVPGALGLALVLAYLIHPLPGRVQVFFKSAFYLPGVVSSVVLALVWAWLFNADFGLLNYLLGLVGVDPVMWLGDRRVALLSVALMTVASGLGVPLLMLLAAMGQIPAHYYEAASLDGASPLKRFWHITLPLLGPTLLYLVVVMTIGSFQVFDAVYLMTNGGPSYATTTLVFMIYESAFRTYDFGAACAQAVVLFILILILALVQFKWLSGGEAY